MRSRPEIVRGFLVKLASSFHFQFSCCTKVFRARSDRKRVSKSSLNNSFLFLPLQQSSTTPASHSLICSATWTRQRRWREAASIRIMAPTTAITIKRRLWRARLITFRWERKKLNLFADADWCRYFNDFPSEYFLRRDTSKHICFNFPETFFPSSVWQSLSAAKHELRMQRHNADDSKHARLIKHFPKFSAVQVISY